MDKTGESRRRGTRAGQSFGFDEAIVFGKDNRIGFVSSLMFRKSARQIRNLHADRPALSYMAGVAIWLLTTLVLLYFVKIYLLTESVAGHLAVSVFGLGILAVHSAMSLFLGDAWKVYFRKLDRENIFIRFLGRFE